MMVGAPILADMYHHKQMTLFMMLGWAMPALVLCCLVVMVWQTVGIRRKRSEGKPSE